MNTQDTILIQSLGWALLHSLWQALLIYCCLRIVLKVSGNITARLKYHLSVVALAGGFAWFVNTCVAQCQRLQGVTILVTQSGADPAATRSYALTTVPTATEGSAVLHNIMSGIEPYFPVLVALYIIGIAFLLLRFVVNLLQVRNLQRNGLSNVDTYWTSWIAQWQDRLDISRKVQLFFSEKVSVPMTMGAFKPVILLPLAAINNLSTDQLEAILLHELAHIKRHDYLLNIIQTIVETILFFNPFIWLISRVIRKEREHCCDDVVLSYMSTPLPYARALAELEVNRHHTLALAATGNKHQLLNRIKRIMEMKKKPVNYTQFGVAAILITALIVSIAWFSPAMAQTKKTVTKEKKGNKTITTTSGTNKNGAKTVTKTIIINDSKTDNNGVHPNDVGNAEDIKKRVQEAMADVDLSEVGTEVSKAMAEVDWSAIGKDIHVAMSNVDWNKINDEVTVAMAKVDWDEVKVEIEKATKDMKNIDWDEIKRELKDAQLELEKGNRTKAHAIVMKSGNATLTAENISMNGKDVNEMFEDMENDGLIDRAKGYTIKKENGALYINGKKQPASVVKKYSDYMDGDKVTIKGNTTSTNINIEK